MRSRSTAHSGCRLSSLWDERPSQAWSSLFGDGPDACRNAGQLSFQRQQAGAYCLAAVYCRGCGRAGRRPQAPERRYRYRKGRTAFRPRRRSKSSAESSTCAKKFRYSESPLSSRSGPHVFCCGRRHGRRVRRWLWRARIRASFKGPPKFQQTCSPYSAKTGNVVIDILRPCKVVDFCFACEFGHPAMLKRLLGANVLLVAIATSALADDLRVEGAAGFFCPNGG